MSPQVGRPLFCAFNRRFDPSFAAVRAKVRAGSVGHVQMIKTTSRDSPLPSMDYLKISGGIFHDCAVHDIDMVTWILGEYPSKVSSKNIVKQKVSILSTTNYLLSIQFSTLAPAGVLQCHEPHPGDRRDQ